MMSVSRQEKRVLLEKLQEMEKERGNFSLSPASLPSTNYEFVDLDECGRHEPVSVKQRVCLYGGRGPVAIESGRQGNPKIFLAYRHHDHHHH